MANWYYNTVSGELANEGPPLNVFYHGLGWHTLKISGSDTFAQASADAKKEFPTGSAPTGSMAKGVAQVPAGTANAATASAGLGNLNQFFGNLTQKTTWTRIGEVALGLLLIGVGLAKLAESAPALNAIPGVKVAKGLLK
jgi:hypothetical protein